MKMVNIPEPCNEDWDKMTPTEQGAFCDKCSIDVIDFSTKTSHEIKLILRDNVGKHLCGHIKKSQLNQLNADYYAWENQTAHVFQSKFVLACLMVFGMALFTGCESEEEFYDDIEMGKMEVVDDSTFIDCTSDDSTKTECNEPPVETTELTCPTENSLQKIEVDSIDLKPPRREMLNGGMVVDPRYFEHLNDTL